MMPALSVVLVNYHGASDTLACLRSLRESSFRNFDVYVVDNASDDNLESMIAAEFTTVTFIQSPTNVGFARGNNIAIQRALDRQSDYVLLLNNDTIVASDTLQRLIDRMEADNTIGIAGPKIYYVDPADRIWYAGGRCNIQSGTASHIGIGDVDSARHSVPGPTEYVTGCCLLARRRVYESIGLLDESFFAYLEDVDFCHRASSAGFGIVYEPTARVWHKVSSSSAWDSPVYLYLHSRNRILMVKKYTYGFQRLPRIPGLARYWIRQFTRLLLKYRDIAGAHAVWLGIMDGIRGVTGIHGEGSIHSLRRPSHRR
jgi:GT2 family glycosyltransferase